MLLQPETSREGGNGKKKERKGLWGGKRKLGHGHAATTGCMHSSLAGFALPTRRALSRKTSQNVKVLAGPREMWVEPRGQMKAK